MKTLNYRIILFVFALIFGVVFSIPSLMQSQSGKKMGNKAAKMLIDRLESENEHLEEENYKTEVIETHLIERESTN